MINFFVPILSVLLFSIVSFAMNGKRPPDYELLDEPEAKKRKLITHETKVEWDPTFFEEAMKEKQAILRKSTTFSPKKPDTNYSIKTPVKEQINYRVSVKKNEEIPVKRLAPKNLMDEFNEAEDVAEENDKELKTTILKFKNIYSHSTAFSTGQWTYVDPWFPEAPIPIDCDDQVWPELINKMMGELDLNSHKDFISSTILSIHKYLPEITKTMFHNADEELVCRHFATMALPVFAKILEQNKSNLRGTIQQIVANSYNPDWSSDKEGHAWNLLTLHDDNNSFLSRKHWFLDVYNKEFVDLSENFHSKDLKINFQKQLKKGVFWRSKKLVPKSFQWPYVELTKEKFTIGLCNSYSGIFENASNLEKVARKIVVIYKKPIAKLIVTYKESRENLP